MARSSIHISNEGIEQKAADYLEGKTITLTMLRDILCDAIACQKKAEAAERHEREYGLDATPDQIDRWRRIYQEAHYRNALAEHAINKYKPI